VEERSHEPLSVDALAAALPITPREAEVLACVASGMTNTQVGRKLAISVRTVIKHLEHLYPKLGVTSRVAATVLAFRVLGGGDSGGRHRPGTEQRRDPAEGD